MTPFPLEYEGWLDQIYSWERYLRYFKEGPPKLLKGRFEKTCLKEYAETFKTVCLLRRLLSRNECLPGYRRTL
jgi:hypothetical protein